MAEEDPFGFSGDDTIANNGLDNEHDPFNEEEGNAGYEPFQDNDKVDGFGEDDGELVQADGYEGMDDQGFGVEDPGFVQGGEEADAFGDGADPVPAAPAAGDVDAGLMDEPMQQAAPVQDPVVDEDNAALKAFERQWKLELEEKDAKNEAAKREMKENAQKELEKHYETKRASLASKAKMNREHEDEFMNTINEALTAENPWERIVTLVDLNNKNPETNQRDVTRLKMMLLGLKNAPQKTD